MNNSRDRRERIWSQFGLGIVLITGLAVNGCGGGGGTTPTNPVPPTQPDMGTVVNVNNPTLFTNQYQIKNAASGLVLGIRGQSQGAGTNVIQETNTSSP